MGMLNAHFDDQWHHAETAEEVTSLISELIATLRHEKLGQWYVSSGDDALLCFSDVRLGN